MLSHEIPEDSIQIYDETNNLFNPIHIEDYTAFTADQKTGIETRCIENGLLTQASERTSSVLEPFLSQLPGMDEYTLVIR